MRVLPQDARVLRVGTTSLVVPIRGLAVAVVGAALLALAVVVAVAVGSTRLALPQALDALQGTGDRADLLLVQRFRLPRVVAGAAAGAALGLSGLLTQTVAVNRLATPDLLGVNQGAVVAVMVGVVGGSAGMLGAWWAGPVGAGLAAMAVTSIAGGLGRGGYRLLVVGVAVTTFLGAGVNLALSRQDLGLATQLYLWTVGSLANRGYGHAVPVLIALALTIVPVLLAARELATLCLGTDVASSLGVNVRRTHALALVLAVALAGMAVTAAGPVAFVALAAPVAALRLVGSARLPVLASLILGALLVVIADTVGRVIAPVEVPVGIVTSLVGGPVLLYLLLRPAPQP